MEKLNVLGAFVEVDYAEELEIYIDRMDRVRFRGEKVQACSPFRVEKNPSFAVNLDNGSWVDSGADNESERKGSFVTLLAHFRGESYEDCCDYLLNKYTHLLDDADGLSLKLDLQLTTEEKKLDVTKYLSELNRPSNYLCNRGIDVKTQQAFGCGVTSNDKAIILPWHDKDGEIINLKYRSMQGKEFWFCKEGKQIKNHLFGLWKVRLENIYNVWVVESEIDALYLWANGIPAIAFGGASMNKVQKDLILNSEINTIVIATDNDNVGQRFKEELKNQLIGYVDIKEITFPTGKKDVNDLTPAELSQCKYDVSESITLAIFKQSLFGY